MSAVSRRASACLLVLVSTALSACGTTGAGTADSRTGGVAVTMLVAHPPNVYALYQVHPDGVIRYGGGFDARDGDTTCEGELSDRDIADLHSVLTVNHWFERQPRAGFGDAPGGDDNMRHEITFAHPGGGFEIETEHGGGEITPVREFLKAASAKRHAQILDRLPQSGAQR